MSGRGAAEPRPDGSPTIRDVPYEEVPEVSALVLLKELAKRWSADEVSRRAAALAFYTFLALAPLVLLIVSILGLLYGQSGAQAHIIEQARSSLGPTASSALGTVIEHASSRGGGVIGAALGGALLILGAASVFSELQTDLNVIWETNEPKVKGIRQTIVLKITRRLLTFAALLGVGLLLILSVAASALVSGFARRLGGYLPYPSLIMQAAEFLVFLCIATLLMAFLFKILPAAKIRWKEVWGGAFVTAVLFSIGKLGIGLYLGRSSTSSSYGAAGAFVVLLLWIYYSAQIMLLGAEFTAVLAKRAGRVIDETPV